jgi:hypothetical protein
LTRTLFSIKSGIHISTYAEDRQILRDAFDAAIEKPRDTQKPLVIARQPEVPFSAEPKEIPKRPTVQIRGDPQEIDRRKLHKEILQDLTMFGITPDSFGKNKKEERKYKNSRKNGRQQTISRW